MHPLKNYSDSNLTALVFTKAKISMKELNCKTNSESNADPPASVRMMSLMWETADEDGYSEKCAAMKTNDSCVIGGQYSPEKDILCWEGWHCQS